MAQMQKIGKVHTTVKTRDGVTTVTYHETDVVEFTDDMVWLNTGGWDTVTTKTRMNQASNQFDLGYQVYQEKGKWYVSLPGPRDDRQFTAQGRCMFTREIK